MRERRRTVIASPDCEARVDGADGRVSRARRRRIDRSSRSLAATCAPIMWTTSRSCRCRTSRFACCIQTCPTTTARASICSGRSIPAAAWPRSSAPLAPSGTPQRSTSRPRGADLRLETTRAFWALVTARQTEEVVARSVDSARGPRRRAARPPRPGTDSAERGVVRRGAALASAAARDRGPEPARHRGGGSAPADRTRLAAVAIEPIAAAGVDRPRSRRAGAESPTARRARAAGAGQPRRGGARARSGGRRRRPAAGRARRRLRLRAAESAHLPAESTSGTTHGTSRSTSAGRCGTAAAAAPSRRRRRPARGR